MSSNPYPGLRPFEYQEFEYFFGREGQAEEVLRRLQKSHFVAVVGTSGSGKSSLVRAGLLPLLYSGLMFSAGANWRVAIFRPGNSPIKNLAQALVFPPDFIPQPLQPENNPLDIDDEIKFGVTEKILRRSAVGLVDFVKGNNFASQENLLIVVDQFEELFRFKEHFAAEAEQQNAEVEEKTAFVKLLLNAVHDENIRSIYIVITMRSDYLGDCAQFRDLPETINEGQYLIPRMTRDQMREAIEEPAKPKKMSELLVNRLLNDIGDNQDQLPILQHALMRTWEKWEDHGKPPEITLEYYERVGGMAKALSLHADKAYNELSSDQKIIAEKMFRCLTDVDTGNRETRRETELGEICRIIDADISEVIPVIEAFRREGRTFLMPPHDVPLDKNSVIDISHESLIRNWERLKEWVAEEAKSTRLYRRLADDALLHLDNLVTYWRDPALQIALDWREKSKPNAAWAKRYHPAFDEAMKFLDDSEAARAAQIAKDKAQLQRLRVMVAALGVMFLLSSGLALASFYLYSQASISAQQALSSENATRAAKETIAKQNENLDIQNRALDETIKDLEIEKNKTDQINKELNAALIKAEDSEKEQKHLAVEAEKSKVAAEQSAEQARQAEATAKEALINEQKAAKKVEIAQGVMNKTLTREEESRAALTSIEQGDYEGAITQLTKLADEYKNSAIPNKQLGEWWMRHNLGTAHWKNSDLYKAHETYVNALKVLGENFDDLEKKLENSKAISSNQTESTQTKSVFIKTAFQPLTENEKQLKFSKIATYRKLAQVNRERFLNYSGDPSDYEWANLAYEKFFSFYPENSPEQENQFLIDARIESGDFYLANNEFERAKQQFTKILTTYESVQHPWIIPFEAAILKKLAEVELKQEHFTEASLVIKKAIDLMESTPSTLLDPLAAELYDARARIYTDRYRAAQRRIKEIEVKLNQFNKLETELTDVEKAQKLKAQNEKAQNENEKEKFSKLAPEYSEVATGIRNMNLPVNQSNKFEDFKFEPYSDLADAYLDINKCEFATDIILYAIGRLSEIGLNTGKQDKTFIVEQKFKAANYLNNVLKDKAQAQKMYLEIVDDKTDKNVLQSYTNISLETNRATREYLQAGRFLQSGNPEAAGKYFEAYIYINKLKAPKDELYLESVANGYIALASVSSSQGDLVKAEEIYKEGIEFIKNIKFEKLPEATAANWRDVYIAQINLNLADFYRQKANKTELARELYKNAADVFERNPHFFDSYGLGVFSLKNLAEIEKENNNTAEATRIFEQAIAKLENVPAQRPRRIGRYFSGTLSRLPAYNLDHASMLVALVELKGTSDAALVQKRDKAVENAAKIQTSNKDETGAGSCKNGADPEFGEEKPQEVEPRDDKSET